MSDYINSLRERLITMLHEEPIRCYPCPEPGTRDKFTMEASLKSFNVDKMCELIRSFKAFGTVKCIPAIGVAQMESEGRGICIFESRKIYIRRTDSDEDALRIMNIISNLFEIRGE